MPTHVGTDPLDQSGGLDITVTANVEMIAYTIKTAKAVSVFQVLFGKGAVLARGAAIDPSHRFIAFALKAPITAEATAMITFKILSQVVFFIKITRLVIND